MRSLISIPWRLKGRHLAFLFTLGLMGSGLAQMLPVVTIGATDPSATWGGDPGAFTVFRNGPTNATLNVFYLIRGTASNGVDYATIGNWVTINAGVRTGTVPIAPINNGQVDARTVTLVLAPPPVAPPVNYVIGTPSNATVLISGTNVANPPVVNVVATDPYASEPGLLAYIDPGVFTIYRSDVANTPLPVVYRLGGTASNGVDYMTLSNVVVIPAGQLATRVVVMPLFDTLVEGTETVVLDLVQPGCITNVPPPPGCYQVGPQSEAVVYIADRPPPTNCPPLVRIASPPNGAVFRAPVDIPIVAYARACTGAISSVEFFAGTNSLGFGRPITNSPTPTPTNTVSPYWLLVWSNAPLGDFALRALATDRGGTTGRSDPVFIHVVPTPPPPTNRPPIVTLVATDPIAIEGTNCWVWPGITNSTPTWDMWSTDCGRHPFTNCGPKNATFTVRRIGDTNDALTVPYRIGGTASNGVDYVYLPGVVTVPAGARRAQITVVPIDDGIPDRPRTVILCLQPSANLPPDYLLGFPHRAAAIIVDSNRPHPVTAVLADGCFHLNAAGPDGAWFRIEYSTDLVNWTPVCENQVVNGSIDFVDPDAPLDTARFYRAVPELTVPLE